MLDLIQGMLLINQLGYTVYECHCLQFVMAVDNGIKKHDFRAYCVSLNN